MDNIIPCAAMSDAANLRMIPKRVRGDVAEILKDLEELVPTRGAVPMAELSGVWAVFTLTKNGISVNSTNMDDAVVAFVGLGVGDVIGKIGVQRAVV